MEVACLDSTVLIEHYRAKDKINTFLFRLVQTYIVQIPFIVRYEVLRGDRSKDNFWLNYFANKAVLSFDNACAGTAVFIYATHTKGEQSAYWCRRYFDCCYSSHAQPAVGNH